MVVLMGDNGLWFSIILLIVFFYFLMRAIKVHSGKVNGVIGFWNVADKSEEYDSLCSKAYKTAKFNDSADLWYALYKFYKLKSKEQEVVIEYHPVISHPCNIGGETFYERDVALIRGMHLEHEKEKYKRLKRIRKIRSRVNS